MQSADPNDPHAGQPVHTEGPAPADARLTMILVHGRNAGSQNILATARELHLEDVAFVAPQASGNTWYPHSFLAPIAQNEPGITSACRMLARLVASLVDEGIASRRIALLGFSQGACLTLEFAARNARQYAGVFALSGGLIGPPGTPRDYPASFERTPVFLGCSDLDPHIPVERVHESSEVFRRMQATVDERIYPGMGHTVNEDERQSIRSILRF